MQIVDVEFRIVQKVVCIVHDDLAVRKFGDVLQTRKLMRTRDETSIPYVAVDRWTDWQDVPKVTEDTQS